jgi:hypothetical protein
LSGKKKKNPKITWILKPQCSGATVSRLGHE